MFANSDNVKILTCHNPGQSGITVRQIPHQTTPPHLMIRIYYMFSLKHILALPVTVLYRKT